MGRHLIVLIALFFAASCAKNEFAGDAERGSKNGGRQPGLDQSRVDKADEGTTSNGGDGNDGDGNTGGDSDGKAEGSDSDTDTDAETDGSDSSSEDDIEFSDGDKVHTPKACDAGDIKVIPVGEKCPRNMALYTMDDMSSKATVPGRYVCCSLPAGDILLRTKKDSYQERTRTCNTDEVMVGAVDNAGKIYCTKINTEKYSLAGGTKMVCAGEKGGPFGIGAKDCDGSRDFIERNSLPTLIRQLVIGPLGEDGCVSHPYGSLVTQQGGHKCENSASMTLKYKSSGQLVKIFP